MVGDFYQPTLGSKITMRISQLSLILHGDQDYLYFGLNNKNLHYCWLIWGSLFIELGCPGDLGKGWRGDLGTFMISRPIYLNSNLWKFSIWNGVMGK